MFDLVAPSHNLSFGALFTTTEAVSSALEIFTLVKSVAIIVQSENLLQQLFINAFNMN